MSDVPDNGPAIEALQHAAFLLRVELSCVSTDLASQQEVVERLEAQARDLEKRIASCEAAIRQLKSGD